MAVVKELIRTEADGTLSFGDYTLDVKAKQDNFMVGDDSFKVKTYKDITRLERNDVFVYESVPGTAVFGFSAKDGDVSFAAEGCAEAQITLELEAETEYEVTVGGETVGVMSTNLGGKLSLSVEMEEGKPVSISAQKR